MSCIRSPPRSCTTVALEKAVFLSHPLLELRLKGKQGYNDPRLALYLAVVIEHHQVAHAQVTRTVHRLECHAAGDSTIADHGDAVVIPLPKRSTTKERVRREP